METNAKFEIIGVELKHSIDYDYYPDYLGKFTDAWEPGALLRDNRHLVRGSMRYFVSANNVWRNWKTSWEHVEEANKATTIKKYGSLKSAMFQWAKEDMKRLESFGRTWDYIGVTCLASIRITLGEHTFIVQVYDSLYGVESDSPEGIEDVETDLKANVQAELLEIGFSLIETEQAFRKIRRVEDYS